MTKDLRTIVALSVVARGILELADGKGAVLAEDRNLRELASLLNGVPDDESAAILADVSWRNAVKAVFGGPAKAR